MTEIETTPEASPAEPTSDYAHCGECGAPVEPNQRYCVICGAHRAKAADPVARYLSEASSALARVRLAEQARSESAGRRGPLPRVSALIAVVLVIAAAAIGFAVGSSTGGTTVVHTTTAAGGTTTAHTRTATTPHKSKCKSSSYENNCSGAVVEQ